MSTERHYAVDGIQHRTAVLVDDEGQQVLVPTSRLPRETVEGRADLDLHALVAAEEGVKENEPPAEAAFRSFYRESLCRHGDLRKKKKKSG